MEPDPGPNVENALHSLPLPIDIFLDIFAYLSLHDIPRIRRTCKSFLSITQLRTLWYRLIHIQILENSLPIPGFRDGTLDRLSADALEGRLRRAICLRRNWSSPRPNPTKQSDIVPTQEPLSRSVFLGFLPRSSQWLLSVTMSGDMPRRFTVQCWDVNPSPPSCIGILEHVGPFGGAVINSDPTSDAIFALQFANTEIFTIDFSSEDPWSTFVSVIEIEGSREFFVFRGEELVTRYSNSDVTLWNIYAPKYEVILQNPRHLEPEKYQAVVLRDNFIIVIRSTTFEMYALPSRPAKKLVASSDIVVHFPVAVYKWQWRMDTVCVAEHPTVSMPRYHGSRNGRPINFLIRFSTTFPWPINILHHFVLRPNRSYQPSMEIDTFNLPYLMEPKLVQSIGSPIRLFALSHVALGPYGTALFIDSHTEDYFFQSDHGQRLAGEVLAQVSDENCEGEHNETGSDDASSGKASMVFGVREYDEWFRVAMDEEAGRIAVGCVDGGISLFEYV